MPRHGKRATSRRTSQSLPMTVRSRRRFAVGRGLQYGWRIRQNHINQISQPFGETCTFSDGRERRRRARDSQDVYSSSDVTSPSNHSPLGTEAKSTLAMAGMMMATEDLDRLSEMARSQDQGAKD